jgi:hypothetical protein
MAIGLRGGAAATMRCSTGTVDSAASFLRLRQIAGAFGISRPSYVEPAC